jgi:CHAT domain-containing protein
LVFSLVDSGGSRIPGFLRFPEIYDATLPADLVVLSACQTAVGKDYRNEGMLTLAGAFLKAGARAVISSLWKVDDEATAALMAAFYEEMFINGLPPAAALRAAQLRISRQPRWRSPYFWAGFTLQGQWK